MNPPPPSIAVCHDRGGAPGSRCTEGQYAQFVRRALWPRAPCTEGGGDAVLQRDGASTSGYASSRPLPGQRGRRRERVRVVSLASRVRVSVARTDADLGHDRLLLAPSGRIMPRNAAILGGGAHSLAPHESVRYFFPHPCMRIMSLIRIWNTLANLVRNIEKTNKEGYNHWRETLTLPETLSCDVTTGFVTWRGSENH